jgi:hypothetical protein
MGEAMPQVTDLALAFWLEFGGDLSMADELRAVLSARLSDDAPAEDDAQAGTW